MVVSMLNAAFHACGQGVATLDRGASDHNETAADREGSILLAVDNRLRRYVLAIAGVGKLAQMARADGHA